MFRCRERTRIQYQTVRPSMPSPLVQIAIVRAQARKIMNPCAKWRMFFVLPRLPDGRGSCILNGEGKKTARAGSALSKNHPTRGPRQESQDRRECAIDRNVQQVGIKVAVRRGMGVEDRFGVSGTRSVFLGFSVSTSVWRCF